MKTDELQKLDEEIAIALEELNPRQRQFVMCLAGAIERLADAPSADAMATLLGDFIEHDQLHRHPARSIAPIGRPPAQRALWPGGA